MPKSTIYLIISTAFFVANIRAENLIIQFIFLAIQAVTGGLSVWFFSKDIKGDK